MRILVLVFLCCLLYNYANARVYPSLKLAEKNCIQESSLSKTTYFRYQCRLKRGKTGSHFVHLDRARVHCIKMKPCGGFICIAMKPVGVEPLVRDLSDLNLHLTLE